MKYVYQIDIKLRCFLVKNLKYGVKYYFRLSLLRKNLRPTRIAASKTSKCCNTDVYFIFYNWKSFTSDETTVPNLFISEYFFTSKMLSATICLIVLFSLTCAESVPAAGKDSKLKPASISLKNLKKWVFFTVVTERSDPAAEAECTKLVDPFLWITAIYELDDILFICDFYRNQSYQCNKIRARQETTTSSSDNLERDSVSVVVDISVNVTKINDDAQFAVINVTCRETGRPIVQPSDDLPIADTEIQWRKWDESDGMVSSKLSVLFLFFERKYGQQ